MRAPGRPILAVLALALGGAWAQQDRPFERDLYKTGFEHEVRFRAAAVQVAWAAEALCSATSPIEPFALLSVHALRKRFKEADLKLYSEVTRMDAKWRVVWVDEDAPDELKLGDAVLAINGRPLPAGSDKVEVGALLRGGSALAHDDQGFWDVLLLARQDAAAGKPMRLQLEGGRALDVPTQQGCAGSVTASAFDNDPNAFAASGQRRARVPANALLEARSEDDYRWLAAFGAFHLAGKPRPGDGGPEAADRFAAEVLALLGGDPASGVRLSERMVAKGLKVDPVQMDAPRRAAALELARQIKAR